MKKDMSFEYDAVGKKIFILHSDGLFRRLQVGIFQNLFKVN